MQQKKPYHLRYLLTTLFLLLLNFGASANHIVGLDLYYTWVSGNTYKITLVAYGDCGSGTASFGALPAATPEICIFNGNTSVGNINLAIEGPGVEITPVCPADVNNTQCTNISFTIPGIKKYVYSGTYTVSGPSSVWRFVFFGKLGGGSYVAGRAVTITNIVASSSIIELADTLNNMTGHNSSPALTVVPTPFFCLNNTDNYNPGAVDAEGDSLAFSLVTGNGGPPGADCTHTGVVTYVPPYTPTAPLAATTFSFDSRTGQISFFPNALQRSLVVYNVREYRGGVVVGTSQREMTFLVLACTNTGASGALVNATNGVIDDSTHFHICQNTGPFSLDLFPTEANPLNNITVTGSGLPSGMIYNVIGNGTPTPHVVVSWSSTGIPVGSYTFFLTYSDNNCPLSSTQTLAYTITIAPSPTVSAALLSPATCLRKAFVSITPGGSGSPWTVLISRPVADTFQTFPGTTGMFTDSLVPNGYVFTVRSSGAYGCSANLPFNIDFPVAPVISATFTSPTYCGLTDGTITLSGMLAGSSNSISYYLNGILQPVIVRTASSTGTVILTGLSAGTYANIVVTYGNCISSPVGPYTLINPPTPPTSATFTNPSYCGHNDGTITLYHLHPGFIDTIKFYFNGVLQPSQVFTVASDSTITLTGLYAGIYTNITATFALCATTPIGPITLVNPPIPATTATFVNPSYCGHADGSITISGLHAGDADTIKFYLNGVLQPVRIITVSASGTVVLTGLVAGVYTNVTATYGPCVTAPLGPITLVNPPIPPTTATFVNPSYCGHNDGSITISGLHAGDADTIKFYLNGILQPVRAITVSGTGTVVLTALGAGTYSNITANYGPCSTAPLGPIVLVNPPILATTATFTNPSYCGHYDGTITISNLHAGDIDTIKYYLNGVLQAPVTFLVSSTGTVVITGLAAGVYSNITATYGPCVTTPIGPYTLTNPPLLIPTATATSPTYCAARNGTITISNLYPGDADTITYTLNGVPQPPTIRVVSAAGTVVLTGLDQGSYTNIYAAFGPCRTNTVGPFTLVNPPFTLRNVTYNNPTKCGFCDGKLTFYGLHPAQIDTIRYSLNGVLQPLISVTVGTDSTIVLPNLCEGIYSSISMFTTAACVSNIFGPDTLDAPPIIPGFNHTLTKNCKGDTIVFTNTSSPASDLTYVWSFGDGTTSTVTNPVHVYTAPGVYAIKLVITNTRCYDSVTHSVNLDNLVVAGFTSNPDSFLCIGKPVTFTNTSAGTGLNYIWTFGDGTTSTTTDYVHVYSTTGNYNIVLAVSNAVPCLDTARKMIQADPISGITMASSDSVLCKGGAITFNAVYDAQGNTGLLWTFSSTDSIRNVNPVSHAYEDQGLYTVIVKAFYRACPDTTAIIHVNVIPYPFIDLGPDTTICPGSGNPLVLTDVLNGNNPNARWLWNTGAMTPSIGVVEPGNYRVTVNIGGCESSDEITIGNDCYINIPNIFTPNGDGVNDFFLPRDLLTKGLIEFRMVIYNRWGNVLFETRSLNGQGWDGRYNGIEQPEGVFVYTIDAIFKDGQKEHHQGNLTLMR